MMSAALRLPGRMRRRLPEQDDLRSYSSLATGVRTVGTTYTR